jgi:DivIVA domain-containing protein
MRDSASSDQEPVPEGSLTPNIDRIQIVRFDTTLRGYNVNEVDDFLQNVDAEASLLKDDLAEAAERIGRLERQLEEAIRLQQR